MKNQFSSCLKISASAHLAALGLLLVIPAFLRVFRGRPDISRPLEFVVDVSSLRGGSERTQVQPSGEAAAPLFRLKKLKRIKIEPRKQEPTPAETKSASKKNEAAPVSPVKPAQQTTKSSAQAGMGKPLTPEDIKKWLNLGATAGNYNSIPEGDILYKEIIKRAFYNAWSQPSYQEVGGATAEVTVKFLSDGTIVSAVLARKSGSALMDNSVMQAVNSLRRIDGLSPDFLKYNSPVTVSFRVTSE